MKSQPNESTTNVFQFPMWAILHSLTQTRSRRGVCSWSFRQHSV